MKRTREVPNWLRAPLILGAFGALLWLERTRPLRRNIESKLVRDTRNLAVAGTAAITLQLAESPVTKRLTALVERKRLGLLKRLRLPIVIETALAVALLDYTLYVWHVLTHRAPVLWRFHAVHHVDLDLDATTALRFHCGELTISVLWRALQILFIGVSPLSLSVWQTLLMLSILFHHSEVELPIKIERALNRFIVTPRMHGIHHSIVEEETNSNWSSGLTLWDWLHGTLRLNVPQDEITIGVPAYRQPEEVALGKILIMPFHQEKHPMWLLPDGTRPAPHIEPTPRTEMLS